MNGQRCTAGSRLIAEAPIYEDLVQAVAERARNIRVGDPFDEATELGPLIRPEHHERVCGYLESAVAEGARCLAGGRRPAEPAATGNFLEATVFADVTPEMRVFREEIFGPVLVATPFADEAEAIAPRQRDRLRARGIRLDERAHPSPSGRPGHRRRPRLGQLAERPRPPHAVRRRQAERHRP